ncbi:MAG: hypothetical protein SCARUB_01635 [Candidatus Scalindua rubra]|uniref:N-acetyltransferase domain-containing protein n=1 Tax=Candidatus Scalindua rubra TaxID=1872076 RepID=A0A1E3XE71_9BACT|nr:MAG: hypothetical protein SCARUB_01635 [Candidatus Scalindua rubra]
MKDFSFRMYQLEDKQSIYELWRTHFRPELIDKRKEIFSWIAERNPYLMGKATYHVVFKGKKLLAYYGRIPTRFVVKGEVMDTYFCHDVLVHPRFWGKGIADKLVKNA